MNSVGVLNTYRLIMIFVHVYFANWIIDVWGFKLKTFLFLTKINFFVNLFYFFYNGLIIFYKIHNSTKDDKVKNPNNFLRFREEDAFTSNLFKFSFCLSFAVNILYWSVLFFAPGFLGTTVVPLALELFLHGGNMAVLIVDSILNTQCYKEKNLISSNFLIKFTMIHFSIQYLVYYTLNIEVYPMISKLSIPQYSLFGAAGYGLFLIGHFFHDNILISSSRSNKDFSFNFNK